MQATTLFPYEYWGNSSSLPASSQMALEDYFRQYVAQASQGLNGRTAVIRFFSFPRDTVVIGYGQDTDVLKKRDSSFSVVRRITGGAHIQLGPESLAYSIVVPRDGTFSNWREMREYYAGLIAKALMRLGVPEIETNNELANLTLKGRILSSHSSFWGVQSALVHGLIILYPYDVDKIAERVALRARSIGGRTYSEHRALKALPTVYDELRNKLVRARLAPKILRQIVANAILHEITGGRFMQVDITPDILFDVGKLVRDKYGTLTWFEERNPVFTTNEVIEIEGTDGLDTPLAKDRGYCLFHGVSDEDFRQMTEPE